jgi:hypothetical protein
VRAVEISLFVFGIGGLAVTYWGPFWPTVPEIHPVGDVFSLPFSVKNSNNWLSVVDIQFSCALGRSDPKNPKIYAAFNL